MRFGLIELFSILKVKCQFSGQVGLRGFQQITLGGSIHVGPFYRVILKGKSISGIILVI